MTATAGGAATLDTLDDATRELARLAAVAAGGSAADLRPALARAANAAPPVWIEELLLQTYLFAGFPRALNAMREWRRLRPDAATPSGAPDADAFRAAGETTCAKVYGTMYERLRGNVRELHPLLDEWMITEGYGKVLSRPGLDLPRRELCIVAACAASAQDRQLHSHLHGALNVGVAPNVLDALFDSLGGVVQDEPLRSARLLWARVRGK